MEVAPALMCRLVLHMAMADLKAVLEKVEAAVVVVVAAVEEGDVVDSSHWTSQWLHSRSAPSRRAILPAPDGTGDGFAAAGGVVGVAGDGGGGGVVGLGRRFVGAACHSVAGGELGLGCNVVGADDYYTGPHKWCEGGRCAFAVAMAAPFRGAAGVATDAAAGVAADTEVALALLCHLALHMVMVDLKVVAVEVVGSSHLAS